MSTSILDDCDIISQTPEKPKKKLKHNHSRKKNREQYQIIIKTTLNHTPRELYIDTNPFISPIYSSELRVNTNRILSYIFHTHEDFLNYTQDDMPKHNSIRMVGIIKSKSSLYFLRKHQHSLNSNNNLYVIINIKDVDKFPDEDEAVEIFGFLEFDFFADKKLPVLIAGFWKKINRSNLSEYIKCFEIQKSFVPSNYREKVCALNNTTYLEVASDITNIFDDCDESMFKNLTILENNMSELKEIVNTSFSVV